MINLQSLLTVISTLIITRDGRRFPLTLLIIALKRGQTLQRLQLSNILFTADKLRSYNLGQNRWKICTPLPPNQGWENGAFWLLRGFILDFGGDGGLLFHFTLSKIVLRLYLIDFEDELLNNLRRLIRK